MKAQPLASRQFCTFLLDEQLFGIEVAAVQEVIRYQEMTEVPLAPREVRGLLNLRGQIVTAIDLRRRLGARERESTALPMNIVVRTDDGVISFLVDAIGDVVTVDESTFERPPDTLRGTAQSLILGVYKLPHCLLLVLDTIRTATLEDEFADAHVLTR